MGTTLKGKRGARPKGAGRPCLKPSGAGEGLKVHVAGSRLLADTLMRRKGFRKPTGEIDLGRVLHEVLSSANRFVPSKSGSILIDDPSIKRKTRGKGRLYFAACFGKNSSSLVGTFLEEDQGIAGSTYGDGKPYISIDVKKDKKFHCDIDKKINYCSQSIICVPINVRGDIIGVIELINRKTRASYSMDDLALLEIFAGYTGAFMENSLAARQYEELARVDDLSKLFNDRYFFLRLQGEMRRASRDGGDVSLIFFDLDRFKEVNDTYGHLAGSEVLREVAVLLRKVYAGTDAVMARYGGDEYVIILPDIAVEEAAAYGERMARAIASHTFLKKRGARGVPALNIMGLITCSVGVASFRHNVSTRRGHSRMAEALIRAADRAMYEAKARGRDMVCVSSEHGEHH